MIIRMSQPWQHPTTGVWHYRARPPADLKTSVLGSRITVEFESITRTVKVGEFVKINLGTTLRDEAVVRHAAVEAQVQLRWAAERKGTVTLDKRRLSQLAGEWYRELLSEHESNPGEAFHWEQYADLLHDGLVFLDPSSDGIESEPYDPAEAHRRLKGLIHLDQWLETKGLRLSQSSRQELEAAVAQALFLGAQTLIRRANLDYGPDHHAERFAAPAPMKLSGDPASLMSLFEGWAKESQPSQSTYEQWKVIIAGFARFVGHDDANRLRRADVQNWKTHLLDLGLSAKTIRDTRLAALKAVLRWGHDNERIAANVAQGVTLRRTAKPGEDMQGFEPHEAATILKAALKESSPVYRWVPFLLAQSGARVSEVCQLRAEDIRQDKGIWYMSLRPDAGSLKNRGSIRDIPLHPEVLRQGFLEFVQGKSGPLFYSPSRRKQVSKKPSGKIVGKNLGDWVRRLGLSVGLKHRKAPNHAWRHTFLTMASACGVQDRVANAITGHKGTGVRYGTVLLETKAQAIRLLELPGFPSGTCSAAK